MKKVWYCMKAIMSYTKTLFEPFVPIVAISENGHPIVQGWAESPEETLIHYAESLRMDSIAPQVGLYCYEGSHSGEIFFLSSRFETLGSALNHSIVLTPKTQATVECYTAMLNGEVTLLAESGRHFLLNGKEQFKSELYDYDEVELMGNKFLVLDLKSGVPSIMSPLTRDGRPS